MKMKKILNTLNEEFKESKLKDSKFNKYLEEKKPMEQKLRDNNNKISKLKNSKKFINERIRKTKKN